MIDSVYYNEIRKLGLNNEVTYPYEVIRGSFLAVTYGNIVSKGRQIVDFVRDTLDRKES